MMESDYSKVRNWM